MHEFPAQQEISLQDEKAIIGSHECGICFSADELPDKICNNEKCMKQFHSACLSKVELYISSGIFVFYFFNH